MAYLRIFLIFVRVTTNFCGRTCWQCCKDVKIFYNKFKWLLLHCTFNYSSRIGDAAMEDGMVIVIIAVALSTLILTVGCICQWIYVTMEGWGAFYYSFPFFNYLIKSSIFKSIIFWKESEFFSEFFFLFSLFIWRVSSWVPLCSST